MKIQMWDIGRVIPYEQNTKKHPKEQVAKIVESIKLAKGFDQPIVVDGAGVVIKGHGRRLAALQMGLTQVPVLVRDDLTAEEVRASRMADNRSSLSDIDTEMMRLEMADLNVNLLKGIFDDKELEFTMTDLGAMKDDAFIEDLGAAVEAQADAAALKVEELKVVEVPLIKAMGFKSIPGASEIYISRFIAMCELQSGLKGREAFISFVTALTTEA